MNTWLPVEIGLQALHHNEEYALRDWLLLRIASNGKGHCREDAFRAFLRAQRCRRTNIQTIIDRVVGSGMARRSLANGLHQVLVPLSAADMLARYGVSRSKNSVEIPLAALLGSGWRSTLYTYVRAGLGDSPIARQTLESRTGVTKPTQRRGERKAAAHVQPNFARIDLQDEGAALAVSCSSENGRRRSFQRNQSLYLQIANTVTFPSIRCKKHVVRATHGNCRYHAERQPTDGRRYFTSPRRTQNDRLCSLKLPEGKAILPTFLDEGTDRLGSTVIGVWGLLK
jgi:hypothetical protein